MAKVLYIQASPRKDRSKSTRVAAAFWEQYQKAHPDDTLQTFNIFDEDLPPFDGFAVQAKYSIMHGQEYTEEQRQAWTAVVKLIDWFKGFDKYIISLPMWNFGIPYRLKQFFDIITQPTYTFKVGENGYKGLVKGKPAVVVYARGGAYPEGSEAAGYDFQKPYMELILGFIGFENVKSLVVEPTLHGSPEDVNKTVDAAVQKAQSLAADF